MVILFISFWPHMDRVFGKSGRKSLSFVTYQEGAAIVGDDADLGLGEVFHQGGHG